VADVVVVRLRKNATEMLALTLTYLGSLTVPDRPGRFEPRVIKRRLFRYPLMKKPRHKYSHTHILTNSQQKKNVLNLEYANITVTFVHQMMQSQPRKNSKIRSVFLLTVGGKWNKMSSKLLLY